MHFESAGIQGGGETLDVSALSGRVPSLIAENDRDLFPVKDIMQFTQAGLELFQLLFVILIADGR